ncbi:MAG: OmpA family protein [Paludibacteraceae bacterium]|nr:OmpA family protein [Paludibacteraceae bacterium]
MKRKFLGLFVASAVACNAFAQEEVAVDSAAAKGLCHWSLQAHGGVNVINWSKSNDRASLMPDSDFNGQFGAQVEYTFNPLWGLGLDYTYALNNQKKYDNASHEISLFASSNLSNLLAKYRSAGWQKFNAYLNGGLGAQIYDYEVTEGARKGYENDGAKPFAWLGLNFEYNVSKYFAIGLDGQARRATTKQWHPREDGGSWQLMADLGVRFKFGGDRNVRNVALVDYEPKVEVPDITPLLDEQKRQAAEMTSRLEEQINNQNSQIAKLQNELKATQDSLNKHIRDTKPAVRYTPTKEEDEIIKTAFSQLEFESAKAIIKQSSYSSLDGLATLLKAHQEWTVTLKGYTDNSGQAAKNLQLSKDRAAAVKAYLVNKGVSASKIQSFGYGSANPVASNTTLAGRAKNRRVEIELYSK